MRIKHRRRGSQGAGRDRVPRQIVTQAHRANAVVQQGFRVGVKVARLKPIPTGPMLDEAQPGLRKRADYVGGTAGAGM